MITFKLLTMSSLTQKKLNKVGEDLNGVGEGDVKAAMVAEASARLVWRCRPRLW